MITKRKILMPTDDHQNWLNKNKICKIIIKQRTLQFNLETRTIKSKKKTEYLSLFQTISRAKISKTRLKMAILLPNINMACDIVKSHKCFSCLVAQYRFCDIFYKNIHFPLCVAYLQETIRTRSLTLGAKPCKTLLSKLIQV